MSLKCPIINCKVKVSRVRILDTNKDENPVIKGEKCENEYIIHDHDKGILYHKRPAEVGNERFERNV